MNDAVDGMSPWFSLWFPIVFVGGWLAVCAILAEISGWPRLARRYPTVGRPDGLRVFGQVVAFGLVSENNVTGLVLSSEGLYLYAWLLFRVRRDPMLIPWRDVEFLSERRILWSRRYALKLGGTTTLWIKERAFKAMSPYLQTSHAGTGTP